MTWRLGHNRGSNRLSKEQPVVFLGELGGMGWPAHGLLAAKLLHPWPRP